LINLSAYQLIADFCIIIFKSKNMTTANNNQTPKWITIYLWVTTAMATMFSLLAYFKPEIQFGTWETLKATGALSLAGPLGLYLSRNLATVAVGVFALTNKSVSAIKTLLILRVVTDGLDFAHNAIAGNMQGGAFAAVMCAIEIFALVKINSAKKD
jgi:hypothetical protein